MSVYIVTNRKIVEKDGRERISDDRFLAAESTFRIAKVNIAKRIDNPDFYELIPDRGNDAYGEEIGAVARASRLADLDPTQMHGSGRMLVDLYKSMVMSNEAAEVLVFIHGFNYELSDNFKDIKELYKLYVKTAKTRIAHLVYVLWPSRGSVTNYKADQENAELTGEFLSRLFRKTRSFFLEAFEMRGLEVCRQPIHLAAHSMGNQVLEHMVEKISPENRFPLFSEIALLHADASWRLFEQGRAFRSLCELCERTHIYIHRSDDALRVSRLTKNFSRRLGRKGPSNRDDLPTETFILDTSFLPCDSSNLKQAIIDHWGYKYRREVIDDLHEVFNGVDEEDIPNREQWQHNACYFWLKGKTEKSSKKGSKNG